MSPPDVCLDRVDEDPEHLPSDVSSSRKVIGGSGREDKSTGEHPTCHDWERGKEVESGDVSIGTWSYYRVVGSSPPLPSHKGSS